MTFDVICALRSHDVVSDSDITPGNKVNKQLVVHRFSNDT